MEENEKKYGKTKQFAEQENWFTFGNSELKENMSQMWLQILMKKRSGL